MKRLVPVLWCISLIVAYVAGYGAGPTARVVGHTVATAGGQPAAPNQPAAPGGALPPGDHSKIQLAPDQGRPTVFSAVDLRKAHTELQNRSAGRAIANPRDLMAPLVTRTHSYILIHRPRPESTQPPSAEQHEGVTDVYFIVGGSGTVLVGGEIDNIRTSRPGEYGGEMKGGTPFKLQAGDILNIPPNMSHATVADGGGMTYVLMKINVGLYPWSLINGTP